MLKSNCLWMCFYLSQVVSRISETINSSTIGIRLCCELQKSPVDEAVLQTGAYILCTSVTFSKFFQRLSGQILSSRLMFVGTGYVRYIHKFPSMWDKSTLHGTYWVLLALIQTHGYSNLLDNSSYHPSMLLFAYTRDIFKKNTCRYLHVRAYRRNGNETIILSVAKGVLRL